MEDVSGGMGLEERLSRQAQKFFTHKGRWWQGTVAAAGKVSYDKVAADSTCVGVLLQRYYRDAGYVPNERGFKWSSKVLGVKHAPTWNDNLISFGAMKAHLKHRIKHYEGMRR